MQDKVDCRLMVRTAVGDVFINIEENEGANTEAQSWKRTLESLSSSKWSLESPCFSKDTVSQLQSTIELCISEHTFWPMDPLVE